MLKSRLCIAFFAFAVGCAPAQKPLTDYVNPMLGTATLWDSVDLGFKPTKRTWGAEVFPGSSLPNAMVQVSPVTKFHSGAGYQYEDSVIYGFTHTNKGHWNLCHIPLLYRLSDTDRIDIINRYLITIFGKPGFYLVEILLG